MDLFELVGTIAIKNNDANQALDETSQKGEKTESKLGKAFSAVGKGAAVVGKAIGVGLAAGGTAMAGLTVKALNLSGELEQNMGGSEQVFKEYAGKMQDTAKDAFQNMGLSTSDFLGTANKMGALFQGAGFSIEESSGLASDAMQRAADVASIMGIDTSAAMEAIAGAAKGNFTMMDNLGVAMNDTTLQAYALEKGINKSTTEMTNQEKIGLAMEMFMEKTAYAAGNYARENETLAGSLGTAKSALTNFLDGSGNVDQLVTAFSNAAKVIVNNVKEIAPRLISGITDIVNQIVPMIPPLLNQLLPVIIEGAVSLINGLVAAMPGIIGALMACLPALLDGFTQIMNAVIQALPQLVEILIGALPGLIPQLINGLVSMIVTLCTMLPQIIQPIIDNLPMIVEAIVTALVDNLPLLIDAGIQLLMGLFEGMLSLLGKIPEILGTIFDGIVNGIKSLFGIHSPSTVMAEIGRFIMEGLINGIKKMFDAVSKLWNTIKDTCTKVFNSVKDFIVNVWNGIKTTTSNVWNGIKSGVSNAINAVKSTVSNVFNGIKSTATSVWNGIKKAIQNPIESARDLVKNAIEKIKGFFNFEFKWPKLKMPKFAISPSGWKIGDLLEGSIPKLSITWHADAMRNPMIMDKPTIFGYNPATGSLMGGGEAGSEVVSGTGTLLNLIQQAVRGENSGLAQRLDRIISLLVQFFPDVLAGLDQVMVLDDGTLVAKTAPAMDAALGKLAIRKGRGR